MTHEALVLPRIPAGTAKELNRLYAGSRSFVFRAGGREWRFTPDGTAAPTTWRARIYARLGDHDMAFFMDSLLVADWENSGLAAPTLSALPPELAGAALELACQDLTEHLEETSGLPVSCTGINLEEEPAWLPEEGLLFTLTRDDGKRISGAMAAEREGLALAAQLFASAAPAARHDPPRLFVRCRITLPGPELPLDELAAVAPGDILLTRQDISGMDDPGMAVRLVLSPTYSAPARLAGTQLHMEGTMIDETIATPENPEVPAAVAEDAAGRPAEHLAAEHIAAEHIAEDAADIPPAPVPEAPASAMDALPVKVDFDLGGLELTVAEAGSLAPGQVLTTGRDVSSPVRITVSGRVVGAGSLVDVAGRLGVRVETLLLK